MEYKRRTNAQYALGCTRLRTRLCIIIVACEPNGLMNNVSCVFSIPETVSDGFSAIAVMTR